MGYALKPTESLRAGISRVAQEQIDIALEHVEERDRPVGDRVHQIRRCCKNIRGLIRVAETAMPAQFAIEDAALAKAARLLGSFRDTDVMLEIHKVLRAEGLGRSPSLTRWESRLGQQLNDRQPEGDAAQLESCGIVLESVWSRIGRWRIRGKANEAVHQGLGKTYQRARKRMLRAQRERTPKAYHSWRKQVKYHHNHLQLFRFVWPEVMKARARTAQQLGECLGDAHDLAVYQEAVCALTASTELHSELERRQQLLYNEASLLGERLFRPAPGAFSRQIAYLWRLSRKKA